MEIEKILKNIEMSPLSIKMIPNPTEEMKKVAVQKNGLALEYIKEPTKEI